MGSLQLNAIIGSLLITNFTCYILLSNVLQSSINVIEQLNSERPKCTVNKAFSYFSTLFNIPVTDGTAEELFSLYSALQLYKLLNTVLNISTVLRPY